MSCVCFSSESLNVGMLLEISNTKCLFISRNFGYIFEGGNNNTVELNAECRKKGGLGEGRTDLSD